jgi:hypothetical protein
MQERVNVDAKKLARIARDLKFGTKNFVVVFILTRIIALKISI